MDPFELLDEIASKLALDPAPLYWPAGSGGRFKGVLDLRQQRFLPYAKKSSTSEEGHPAAVMDMSFANQAMAAGYLAQNHKTLENKVYDVPEEIDKEVAALKLASMHIDIDTLTPEQAKYMSSWSEGT